MELTKEQIQYIDNRLIDEGVRYWDVRIEMLDHVVTDVENQLTKGSLFNEAVQNTLVKLGWKENFNGGGLDTIIAEKEISFRKNYRRNYRVYLTKIVLEPKTIFFIVILGLVFSLIANDPKLTKFIALSFVVFMGALLPIFIFSKRVYKSIQLNTAILRATFSITMINCFIFVPNSFEYDVFKMPYLVAFVLFFALIDTFLGLNFFFKEYNKVNKTYKKLFA